MKVSSRLLLLGHGLLLMLLSAYVLFYPKTLIDEPMINHAILLYIRMYAISMLILGGIAVTAYKHFEIGNAFFSSLPLYFLGFHLLASISMYAYVKMGVLHSGIVYYTHIGATILGLLLFLLTPKEA